ncbi:TPA: hypothetical protein DDX46_01175 [Candidatus Saccharibacteria bacterium]|nr:MAG: hypothetical protein UW38_C0001G0051 [Candidatus Saccharibacteria bacterium GW2011_GWC2_44_17]OGL23279.1 MAG: hypothetical protein A2791_00270 [Candidatus Saccharibacteria bacterium RIFCSPHIGHO2_01_FULL_46_30]OGL33117.1 MAG: hypothetical protein A3E20_02215 [Candidatus Saccharibacteria bacterium RIFCSPHIGHO2_12_FULL_47_16]HBH77341.1 hypothetical protein [Candidatus Saccharibacteria bacterium]
MAGQQETQAAKARDALAQAKRDDADPRTISKLETEFNAAKAVLNESYRRSNVNPPSHWR